MKVKRRVCSAALTLAMTLSLLVTMVLPAGAVDYAGGSGTRNDPYLIATAQQLKNFRDQVNAGGPGPVRQPHRQRRSGRPGLGPHRPEFVGIRGDL